MFISDIIIIFILSSKTSVMTDSDKIVNLEERLSKLENLVLIMALVMIGLLLALTFLN